MEKNLDETTLQAVHKAHELRKPPRYLVSAMMAGAFIGVGEVLLLTAASPLVASHSGAAKLVEGLAFPLAITMVMFAGAQLFTSNVMVMLVGALSGRTGVKDLAGRPGCCPSPATCSAPSPSAPWCTPRA